jgi:predicted ATPase/DNA-binding CsgD family transcriptional regulator
MTASTEAGPSEHRADSVAPSIPEMPSTFATTAPPTAITPLVGRKRETAAVADMLHNPEVRLLVLTGPGGVGKTRLALTVAGAIGDRYRDGVAFVDLAPLTRSSQVMAAIAAALGVRHSTTVSPMDAIIATIRTRRLLLVIDNIEHVADAALELPDLLMVCSGLTILATSRWVLSIYGEHVFPVPPLAIPPVPTDGPTNPNVIRSLMACDAVQLFARRAAAVRADFTVNERNAHEVATICRLLDGLPLAIELAAARVGILSPKMLAERLQHRLPLLDDGPRNVPDRLRTMRNAIGWSYDLLTEEEQAAFRRLAIHASTWTLSDAVITVAEPDSMEPRDEMETLELISSLADKSLVRQIETSSASPHFGLLQTLREFGLEQLEVSGEREAVERRHALAMIAIAERAGPELTGPNQVASLDLISSKLPDLQAAFGWAIEHDPPDLALRLATSLWRYSYTRGPTRDGREWIAQALARYPDRTSLRAHALNGMGILAGIEWDFEAAQQCQNESLEIALEVGDLAIAGMAHMGIGDNDATAGRHDDARAHYEEAERIFRALGDQRQIAVAMTNVANLLWSQQKLEEAIATNERARILYQSAGDQRGIGWSATNIGRIAAQLKDYRRAIPNLQQALEMYDLLGDRGGFAETLEGIAQVAIGTSDYSRACSLLAAADGLREAVNHPIAPIDREEHTQMLATLRRELGESFDTIWNTDHGMSQDEARTLTTEILSEEPAPAAPVPRVERDDDATSLIRQLGISEREIEVLSLVAAGKTDREIAEELFIGVRTVQSHVANLLTKLDVNARSAAVARALRSGIIT